MPLRARILPHRLHRTTSRLVGVPITSSNPASESRLYLERRFQSVRFTPCCWSQRQCTLSIFFSLSIVSIFYVFYCIIYCFAPLLFLSTLVWAVCFSPSEQQYARLFFPAAIVLGERWPAAVVTRARHIRLNSCHGTACFMRNTVYLTRCLLFSCFNYFRGSTIHCTFSRCFSLILMSLYCAMLASFFSAPSILPASSASHATVLNPSAIDVALDLYKWICLTTTIHAMGMTLVLGEVKEMAKEKAAKVVLHGNGVTHREKTRIGTRIERRTSTCPPMILTSPYATIVGLHNTARIKARLTEKLQGIRDLAHEERGLIKGEHEDRLFSALARTSHFKLSSPKNTKHGVFDCRPSGKHFT